VYVHLCDLIESIPFLRDEEDNKNVYCTRGLLFVEDGDNGVEELESIYICYWVLLREEREQRKCLCVCDNLVK
jgi:hypothetical protein